MSGAELAGVVLGGVMVALVLGLLAWSDYRNRQVEATIGRTVEQYQRSRGGRW